MGVYSVQDYFIYILILFAVIYIFLKISKSIKLGRKFIALISPYILTGIFIRLLVDIGEVEFNQFYSVTPGVYLFTIAIGLIFLSVGVLVRRFTGIDYWILPFFSGLVISLYLFYRISSHLTDPVWVIYPVSIAFFITFAVYIISFPIRMQLFRKIDNLSVIFAHLLDGSATFLALDNYSYFYEEHLLPRYIIALAGDNPIVMIPLKLLIILVVVYLIERWYLEENKRDESHNFYFLIKLVIFIVGIGPGIRNTLLPALTL